MQFLAHNRNPGAIEELRGKGFDVDARDDDETPLMFAASVGNAKAVQFLLDEGADVDALDYRGFSAVFRAVSHRRDSTVQLLLERGADVQVQVLDLVLHERHFSTGELVLARLALRETLGTPGSQRIRTRIDWCDRFGTRFESSKQQLSMRVYESITLLDLLTVVTDEKFEMHARNAEFVSKTQAVVGALRDSRYFRTILQRRLSKAVAAVALKNETARIVCEIMGTSYDGFPLVADNVIRYLEHEDMKNLIEAF